MKWWADVYLCVCVFVYDNGNEMRLCLLIARAPKMDVPSNEQTIPTALSWMWSETLYVSVAMWRWEQTEKYHTRIKFADIDD